MVTVMATVMAAVTAAVKTLLESCFDLLQNLLSRAAVLSCFSLHCSVWTFLTRLAL
jgi:hypothetical protein